MEKRSTAKLSHLFKIVNNLCDFPDACPNPSPCPNPCPAFPLTLYCCLIYVQSVQEPSVSAYSYNIIASAQTGTYRDCPFIVSKARQPEI